MRDDAGSAGESRPDCGLSRGQRLTRSSQFSETYAQGSRWVGRTMVFWRRDGADASLRLGVVASRKVGNAVARARAKRKLREAYRRNRFRLRGQADVVLVARAYIGKAHWQDVERELLSLAEKAGLFEPEKE